MQGELKKCDDMSAELAGNTEFAEFIPPKVPIVLSRRCRVAGTSGSLGPLVGDQDDGRLWQHGQGSIWRDCRRGEGRETNQRHQKSHVNL